MTVYYRGAITAAEDRNHDKRKGLSPPELEALTHTGRMPEREHPTQTVSPVVNHGRWVIPCPWCLSASVASRTDHRFYCVECRNAGAEGKWVKVVWPEFAKEIEGALLMRPNPRTRNWNPTEGLDQLLTENEQHGVI